MLTPEEYKIYFEDVSKLEEYLKENLEVIEKVVIECTKDLVDIKNVALRDCHKCVYEVGCHGNPVGCTSYKRDAPDGGYYG